MPKSFGDKRERQYEHIKEGYEKQGKSEGTAEEIAARTVNKTRREHGETKAQRGTASGSGAGHGKASGGEETRQQLYEEARKKGIDGRSTMDKQQLKKALGR